MVKDEQSNKHLPDNFVIVIGRQFGSGGRTIGKLIADRLGIEYYDTRLISGAAEAEGIDPEIFSRHDEKKPSILKTLLQGAYGIADNFHSVPLGGERAYAIQSKIIRDISKKGSCVIVGRNADFILRDHPHILSVFLHSPIEKRVSRILERDEAKTPEKALEMAISNDKRRESYYNFFTGEKKWGLAHNYHLCLDTSTLPYEAAAELIITLAREKWEKQ